MADLAGPGVLCIGYDRRGHGRSGDPSHGYEFDMLADDLAAVIEQLDLHDTTLLGQSIGCGEVVRYLSRHGSNRVARVVLVSTITPFALKTEDNPEGADQAALEDVRKVLSKDMPNPLATYAPTFFGSAKNHVSQEIMDWWVRMMVDGRSLYIFSGWLKTQYPDDESMRVSHETIYRSLLTCGAAGTRCV
jgi:non-heme chloroperoxidase